VAGTAQQAPSTPQPLPLMRGPSRVSMLCSVIAALLRSRHSNNDCKNWSGPHEPKGLF